MKWWFGRDIEANFLVKNLRPKFGPDSEDELNQLVIWRYQNRCIWEGLKYFHFFEIGQNDSDLTFFFLRQKFYHDT